MNLEDSLHEAVLFNADTRSSEYCKRGIAAFLKKDKLTW